MIQRIAVIGCPGAGKTTFSKKLAKALQLPLHHLDFFYYDDGCNYQHDEEAWRRQVSHLCKPQAWIIDGNHKSTFDIRFKSADAIIYLDYPLGLTLSRAIRRRIIYRNKKRDDMPAAWNERLSLSLTRDIVLFNQLDRRKIYTQLSKLSASKAILVFKKPDEAITYLATLQ